MPPWGRLSDEEKKDTSDDFELHLELADSSNIAAVLIPFSIIERRDVTSTSAD